MTKTTLSILTTALMLSSAAAQAQTSSSRNVPPPAGDGRIAIGISLGGQISRSFDALATQPVYGENATVLTSIGTDGGPLLDINAAYRFTRRLGAGIGFSTFGSTSRAAASATVPSAVFYSRPNTVALPEMDSKRTERAVYLHAVWFHPITEEIEVDFFAGPSFISLRQDVISDFSVPSGTQDVNPVVSRQSATAIGGIVGADVNYFVTRRAAVGAFLRFNAGAGDFDFGSDVNAGGFQLGIGARFRY